MSTVLDWQQRRELVIARIARERGQIGSLAARLLRPVQRVEQVTQRTQIVLRQLIPLWLPLAVLLLLRPRRVLKWSVKLLGAYRTFRQVRRLVG
jgi:hypothetical protein